mmetsp:Transcript_53737/g.128033  ORF Transcript_53737/g.128033 Transcript_53737/m.128033 type:complete len:400 (-) Transcript_53737:3036-4235(-)
MVCSLHFASHLNLLQELSVGIGYCNWMAYGLFHGDLCILLGRICHLLLQDVCYHLQALWCSVRFNDTTHERCWHPCGLTITPHLSGTLVRQALDTAKEGRGHLGCEGIANQLHEHLLSICRHARLEALHEVLRIHQRSHDFPVSASCMGGTVGSRTYHVPAPEVLHQTLLRRCALQHQRLCPEGIRTALTVANPAPWGSHALLHCLHDLSAVVIDSVESARVCSHHVDTSCLLQALVGVCHFCSHGTLGNDAHCRHNCEVGMSWWLVQQKLHQWILPVLLPVVLIVEEHLQKTIHETLLHHRIRGPQLWNQLVRALVVGRLWCLSKLAVYPMPCFVDILLHIAQNRQDCQSIEVSGHEGSHPFLLQQHWSFFQGLSAPREGLKVELLGVLARTRPSWPR